MSTKIVFNHFYRLKHDEKRTYILSPYSVDDCHSTSVNTRWVSKIHPYFAMFFSFLSQPIEFEDAVQDIAYFLEIPSERIRSVLNQLVNNSQVHVYDYENVHNIFPRNLIIDEDKAFISNRYYTPEQFNFEELNLNQVRPYTTPLSLVWMVNNTCLTDCVYCYADKETKSSSLSIEQIDEILKDADRQNIADVMLTGGDFFLYKNWDLLLNRLLSYNYRPDLLSTKVPITKESILKLKKYNLRVQISLDALDEISLKKILNVNASYLDKMKKTIELLDLHNISYQIATVLTDYNKDVENLNQLHTFLSKFTNVVRWDIRIAFKSLYSKKNFDTIKIKRTDIDNISNWVDNIKKTSNLNISWSLDKDNSYFLTKDGSQNFIGAKCSANVTNLVILPDGNVTLCEQLYWKKRFIVGNILQQTISEIWNSPKALDFINPPQSEVNPQSACHGCKIYDTCIEHSNKCIADILKAYGDENYDFPDPRCSQAPKFINNLLHT